MKTICNLAVLISGIFISTTSFAEPPTPVKVGVATVLSGDFANLGQNVRRTIETYSKYRLRHPLEFTYEDAGISSQDGLRAYQALINQKKVDMLIGATSSNGTMAGSSLMNSTHTVMITPVTGGSNVDGAGEYVFRIGNSDVLNGTGQADLFKTRSLMRVALLTEQTEYTDDIAKHFAEKFKKLGGTLSFNDEFAPGTTDFKPQVARILSSKPEAIFMPTQTGVALALFLKQLHELGGFKGEIHTTFVAAPNTDARTIAGDLLKGVYYLDPAYDKSSAALYDFMARYKKDHQKDPDIPFHTAGTVDALDMLQNYLDQNHKFDRKGFKDYLLSIKNYKGLMGTYSFDKEGNSDLGFEPASIN